MTIITKISPISYCIALLARKGGFVAMLFVGALSSACGLKGSGHVVEETYLVGEFDKVNLSDGFQGTVVMGDEHSIRVRCDDNFVEHVDVHREGGTVYVDFNNKSWYSGTLEVLLVLPELSGAKTRDGSRLEGKELVLADDLEAISEDGSSLELFGDEEETLRYLSVDAKDGSDVEIGVASKETTIELSDGSSLKLVGEGESMALDMSDGSDLSAINYHVEKLTVSLRDGTSADVWVSEHGVGSLEDGSSMNVWGGGHMDVRVTDGASLREK